MASCRGDKLVCSWLISQLVSVFGNLGISISFLNGFPFSQDWCLRCRMEEGGELLSIKIAS